MTKPIDISSAVVASRQQKIGPRAVNSNRCSMMGLSCDRRIVLERTRWQDKKMHDAGLQAIFDLGTALEQVALDEIRQAGFRIVQQQRDVGLPEADITGSIDAAIDIDGKLCPLDVKTMSPWVWQSINEPADFFDHKYGHVQGYPTQILLYAHLLKSPWGVLYCLNKVTGAAKDIWFKTADYADLIEATIERAKSISVHVRNGTLPDRITDLQTCSRCPFTHVCFPDKDFGPGAAVLDDPEFLDMLRRWDESLEISRVHGDLDEAVKERVRAISAKSGNVQELVAGEFLITVKQSERKSWHIDEDTKKLIGELRKTPYTTITISKVGSKEE